MFVLCLETALQDFKKDPKLKQEYREAKKLLNEVCTPSLCVLIFDLFCTIEAFTGKSGILLFARGDFF